MGDKREKEDEKNMRTVQNVGQRKKAVVIAFTKGGSELAASLCCRFPEEWEHGEAWEIHAFVPERFWQQDWQEGEAGNTNRSAEKRGNTSANIGTDMAANRSVDRSAGVKARIHVRTQSLSEWTAEQFVSSDALIFIGAAGIAVRAVAPFLKDKLKDPAVLVIDEKAQYVIPILSGHVGGANLLAEKIAGILWAVPVITTATDVNQRFAVDVFAVKNHLSIWNRDGIRQISGELLEGKPVGLFVDGGMAEGMAPEGVCVGVHCEKNIYITAVRREDWVWEAQEGKAILLIPRNVTLGIGCRRGVEADVIEWKVQETLAAYSLFTEAVCQVASVDRKRDEAGLLELTARHGWDFVTFPADELQEVSGEFQESAFVKRTIGVGNVCERAAVLASGGLLRIPKQAGDGVTVAAAWGKIRVSFDGKKA